MVGENIILDLEVLKKKNKQSINTTTKNSLNTGKHTQLSVLNIRRNMLEIDA